MISAADCVKLNGILSDIGLPAKIKGVSLANILRIMQHDKKFLKGKNRFVLAQAIGKVKVVAGVSPSIIEKAIRAYQ